MQKNFIMYNLVFLSLFTLVSCGGSDRGTKADFDEDGIFDDIDICRNSFNPYQLDLDGDGIGDSCDSDIDGDSVVNEIDNCIYTSNSDQKDGDEDDIGDICDLDPQSNDPKSTKLSRLVATGRAARFIGGDDGSKLRGVPFNFGKVVTNVGDVNGNGFDDYIIGFEGASLNTEFDGVAYLIFGSKNDLTGDIELTNLEGIPHIKFQKSIDDDRRFGIGSQAEAIGDVNHDGIDDFLLSSSFSKNVDGNEFAGEVYLIFGRQNWFEGVANDGVISREALHDIAIRFQGSRDDQLFGDVMKNIGDINNDGINDVIFSGSKSADNSSELFIMFGNSSWNESNVGQAYGIEDINDNGEGGVTIIQPSVSATSEEMYGLGKQAERLGDFNDDGIDDFAFTYSDDRYENTDAGVFVVYGKGSNEWKDTYTVDSFVETDASVIRSLQEDSDKSLVGVQSMGLQLSHGDLNGDGKPDLVVPTIGDISAEGEDPAHPGVVSIYWGDRGDWPAPFDRTKMTDFLGVNLKGAENNLEFGSGVEVVSDWNGDGISELIVSANRMGETQEERQNDVYVIYGKENWSEMSIGAETANENVLRIQMDGTDSRGVPYLNNIGDINNDGLDDFTVADPAMSSNGLEYNGEFYIIYGFKELYPNQNQ